MNPARGGWFIGLTLFLALVLAAIHLPQEWPEWLGWMRPQWTAVVVFFWVLHFPNRFGLIWAWVLGVLLDVLQADPLGLNALSLATITYVTWKLYERLRMYTVVQQCGVVFLLTAAAELFRLLVHALWLDREISFLFITGALMSGLIWPPVEALLLQLSSQFRVDERG